MSEVLEYGRVMRLVDIVDGGEIPVEVRKIAEYDYAQTRATLVLEGIDLGPVEIKVGPAVPGRTARPVGWYATGFRVPGGDNPLALARGYLTQAFLARAE